MGETIVFQYTTTYSRGLFSCFLQATVLMTFIGCKPNTKAETTLTYQAEAYKKINTRKLLPFCEAENKCGYITPTGKIEIPTKFQRTRRFDNFGLAPIKLDGKWGYINQTGKIVIPPVFSLTESFQENGLAIVGNAKKYGLINVDGKIVLPIKYDRIFEDNFTTTMRSDNFRDRMRIKKGKKWGYIDKAGKVVIPPKFKKVYAFGESGLARFESERRFGFINKSGEVVIPATFQLARDFDDNGLASVRLGDKSGFIDKSGKFVIPAKYNRVGRFNDDGLCPVQIGHKTGYINTRGEMIIEPKFHYLISNDNTEHGLIPTQNLKSLYSKNQKLKSIKELKWGFTDTKGRFVIPARFDRAHGFSLSGVAAVRKNKKWGLINKKGKFISSVDFDTIHGPFSTAGFWRVKKGEKSGLMSSKGNIKIPVKFDRLHMHQSFQVTRNYFINLDNYPAYYENYAQVKFGDKVYPVNLNGKPIGFNYADVRP